jgi:tyrosyl-tRNA synthetase
MDSWEGSRLNESKEILAYDLTKLVHGEEEAKKAQEGARALFSCASTDNMPKAEITDADFVDGKIDIMALLVASKLTTSRSEARRAVEQGGVSVNGEKVTDIRATYSKDSFGGDFLLKRGKKNFFKITY